MKTLGTHLRKWLLTVILVQGSTATADTWLLHSVNIIDVATGAVTGNQQLLIQDGRITAIGDSSPSAMADTGITRIIDGKQGFVMPGLIDMHAHVRHPLAPSLIFPQFVSHGVTGIREMNSECDGPEPGMPCLSELQQWQQQIQAGSMTGPRLLALSSFPVNPPWDYAVTEDQIRGLVAEMDNRGADLIKTYFRLSMQGFRWLTDEASKRNLMVAGHLPVTMTVSEAARSGLDSLEHARDLLFDCFPGSAEFRATERTQNPTVDWLRQMVSGHDEAQCAQVFDVMKAHETWYVPTHVTRRMDALVGDAAFRNDPRRQYVWPDVLQSWDADADAMLAMAPTAEDRAIVTGFYQLGLDLTARAHRAGVRVLMGTDSGDSFSYFGSGAHDELKELVKAGLTPAQALRAATLDAAEFLGVDDDYGRVAAGNVADLILLRDNPLTDMDNIGSIEAVIMGQRYYDRATLDSMLEDVADAIAGM